MEFIIAIVVGLFYAAGVFLMMRQSLVKLIIGLIMIGNGANLLIFLVGRLIKGTPPLIHSDEKILDGIFSDPVPQALILTAIVISFGLQSFAIILIRRAYKMVKTDDLDKMNSTDEFA